MVKYTLQFVADQPAIQEADTYEEYRKYYCSQKDDKAKMP